MEQKQPPTIEESVFTAYGDRELWYATGTIPEGEWSLPLNVDRYRMDGREYAKVSPIAALPIQAEKIKELFRDRAVWHHNGSFLVEAEILESLARKAQGVTPKFYRKWPGLEDGVPNSLQLHVQPWEITEKPSDEQQFLKFLSNKRGISYKLLRLVWWMIKEEAPNWMIGEGKPVDLGFVVLYPIPMRANWKEILLHKHPGSSKIFNKPTQERDYHLLETGFLSDICKGHNIAINKTTHLISWHIEAVPQKDWMETSDRIEASRMKAGKTRYACNYENLIQRLLPSILEAFRSYIEKIAIPFARIRQSSKPGSRSMVPYSWKGSSRVVPKVRYPCRIVVNDKLVAFEEHCPPLDIQQKIAGLPKVSPLLPEDDDVRDSRGIIDVAEPKDGRV